MLLGTIVFLIIVSQLVVHFSIKKFKEDAAIINMAHKQRQLSQLLLKEKALSLFFAKPKNTEFDSISHQLIHAHNRLMSDTLYVINNKAEKYSFNNLNNAFNLMMAKAQAKNMPKKNAYMLEFNSVQEAYMKEIDKFVLVLTESNFIKVNTFSQSENIIGGFSLFIVIIQFVFIFLPAIKRMKSQKATMQQTAFTQSHIVRQPVANILAIIPLIDMKSLTPENAEYLEILKNQAIKIDDIIRTNAQKLSD